jgi:putative hydrolase of the HAD superfamily
LTAERVEAVLFDWGGTLTTFHNVDLLDAWRAAAAHLAPDRADEVAAALLAVEDDVWKQTGTTLQSGRLHEILAEASRRTGLPVERELHELATAAYFDFWSPTTVARPDARPTLVALRARGLRTGLLSNTHWPRARHESWLERDGLLELLDERVYTSDLDHVKPHPAAFRALLDAVGVDASAAVFVGDRLWDDVHGAQSLGLRTIWIRNDVVPRHDVTPDAVVDDLAAVVAVVDGWLDEGQPRPSAGRAG